MDHSGILFKIITTLIWPRRRTLHLKNKLDLRGENKAHFNLIAGLSLFGWESISMAHLDLVISAHSSLQKCSKSVRLWGLLLCTRICGGGASDYPRWALAGPFLNFIPLLMKPQLVSFGYILAKWWHWSKLLWQNWLVCGNVHIFLNTA